MTTVAPALAIAAPQPRRSASAAGSGDEDFAATLASVATDRPDASTGTDASAATNGSAASGAPAGPAERSADEPATESDDRILAAAIPAWVALAPAAAPGETLPGGALAAPDTAASAAVATTSDPAAVSPDVAGSSTGVRPAALDLPGPAAGVAGVGPAGAGAAVDGRTTAALLGATNGANTDGGAGVAAAGAVVASSAGPEAVGTGTTASSAGATAPAAGAAAAATSSAPGDPSTTADDRGARDRAGRLESPASAAGPAAPDGAAPATPDVSSRAASDTTAAGPAGTTGGTAAATTGAAEASAPLAPPVNRTAAPLADPGATASAQTARPLAEQLSGHLVALSRRGPGEHLVSVRVAPEEFGPVTVRAVVGADGHVRVELHAPSEAGREALRQALGDLRRDGAAAGFGTALDLAPNEHGDDGRRSADGEGRTDAGDRAESADRPATSLGAASVAPALSHWSTPNGAGLDVIA